MERAIRNEANRLGFSLVGITTTEPIDSRYVNKFRQMLANDCFGTMAWLGRDIDKRFSPRMHLLSGQSVICVGFNYKPSEFSDIFASYSLYPDYHDFITERLRHLAGFIKTELCPNLEYKICVDSAAITDRLLCHRAGLGFIGRNGLLTHPEWGSFLLLGEIITNIKLQPDAPLADRDYCKNCNLCIASCPTSALSRNGFDAGKCLSFLTIEYKGQLSQELTTVFGCDKCISACPYNSKVPVCRCSDFEISKTRLSLTASDILNMSETEFVRIFKDTAVFRTGLKRLQRNAVNYLKKHKK